MHKTPSYIPYKAKGTKPWGKFSAAKMNRATVKKIIEEENLRTANRGYYEQSFTNVAIPNTTLAAGLSTQFMLPATGDGSGFLAMGQGDQFNQRRGNKVMCVSIHAHGQIAITPSVVGGYDTGTISLIWDKRPNGLGYPSLTGLPGTNVCTFSNSVAQDTAIFDDFTSSTPSNNVQGNIFMNSVIQGDRFITLRKFDYTVNADGPQTIPFDLFAKMNKDQSDVRWGLASTTTSVPTVSKNSFYLIARSVNGSSQASGQFRFSFANT